MIVKQVTPDLNCPICRGCGETHEIHPWGSTTATEVLWCDCVIDILTDDELEDYDLGRLDIEIVELGEGINEDNR